MAGGRFVIAQRRQEGGAERVLATNPAASPPHDQSVSARTKAAASGHAAASALVSPGS